MDPRNTAAKDVASEKPSPTENSQQTPVDELLEDTASLRREILRKYGKPLLRPVISNFYTGESSEDINVKTEIYQHNKLQRGPILKESECTVITTASGFAGDSLHLGVDLYASEPLKDGDGSRKGEGENRGQELLFQKEVIIIQTNLMLTRLRSHLETLEFEIERKREFLADQTPSFRVGIERLKWKLFKKCEAIAWKELSKQMKLVEKEYTRQLKFLRKLCEIETEARRKETRATEKYRQKQIKLYAEMAKRKGEYAKNNWRPISEIVGEENLDQDRELLATLDCSKDSETHETLCEVAGIICKAVNPEPEAEKSSSCN